MEYGRGVHLKVGHPKIYDCKTSSEDDLWRGNGQKRSSTTYPADHPQVKQCVSNTIATSEYGRNRGNIDAELPSIDGIVLYTKKCCYKSYKFKINFRRSTRIGRLFYNILSKFFESRECECKS